MHRIANVFYLYRAVDQSEMGSATAAYSTRDQGRLTAAARVVQQRAGSRFESVKSDEHVECVRRYSGQLDTERGDWVHDLFP